MSRIPHCLDNWLIDGGKVVSALSAENFRYSFLFNLVSSLANSSIVNVEETCSSETSINFQLTTWRYGPKPLQCLVSVLVSRAGRFYAAAAVR
jgi:hypothetical protein